jgi:predicted ATP-grasp superfamily ATP-dependent carboligase
MPPESLKSQNPYAIVIDLDEINGLQTSRILAQRGVPVIGIANDPQHYACHTNSCEAIIFTDNKSDDLIRTLEELGPNLKQKAVLFPCEDISVLLISQHRKLLKQWYHIALPKEDMIEMMVNKLSFYDYAKRKGFPIPQTFYVHNRKELEEAAESLTFPSIIKPPTSATKNWEVNCKLKGYKVTNKEELFRIYDRCEPWADMLIVQDFIEGPESNLYSCNCYFNADSQPLVTFVARKLRQWPPITGESCLGEEVRDNTVLELTLQVYKSINHYGLGYLEIKKDERSGEYFIIEPNIGRPTGRSAIAEAGGVDLVYTMYCDVLGLPLPPNREQKYEGVKWIYFKHDLQSAIHQWRRGQLSVTDWWRSISGKKTDAVFSWKDLGPFWFDLVRSMRLFIDPEERKKRNFSDL